MRGAMRTGVGVAVFLAVLTVAEYVFAVEVHDDHVRFAGLALTGVAKAVLIVQFFMHFSRLWNPGEAH